VVPREAADEVAPSRTDHEGSEALIAQANTMLEQGIALREREKATCDLTKEGTEPSSPKLPARREGLGPPPQLDPTAGKLEDPTELRNAWAVALNEVVEGWTPLTDPSEVGIRVLEAVEMLERQHPALRLQYPEKNAANLRRKTEAEEAAKYPRGVLEIDVGEPLNTTDAADQARRASRQACTKAFNYDPFTVTSKGNSKIFTTSKRAMWLRLQAKQAHKAAQAFMQNCETGGALAAVRQLVTLRRINELIEACEAVRAAHEKEHPTDSDEERDDYVAKYVRLQHKKHEEQQTAACLGYKAPTASLDADIIANLEARRNHAAGGTEPPPRAGPRQPVFPPIGREEERRGKGQDWQREQDRRTDDRGGRRYDDYASSRTDTRGGRGGGRGGGAGGGKTASWPADTHAGLAGHDCSRHRSRRDQDCHRCFAKFPNDPGCWSDHDWRKDCKGGLAPAARRRDPDAAGGKRPGSPPKEPRAAKRRFSDSD
jgi:hypothetical protein